MITVERIDETFGPLRWDGERMVSHDFVAACMRESDIEVLGALYGFVGESRYAKRISPPLERGELLDFLKMFFARCLREDPQPEDFLAQRSLTRFAAGWDLVRWYVSLWKAEAVDLYVLEDLKSWIGDLFIEGSAELRDCLVHTTLEPLLASPTIRHFFADWRDHPTLGAAYSAATHASERAKARAARAPQPLTR